MENIYLQEYITMIELELAKIRKRVPADSKGALNAKGCEFQNLVPPLTAQAKGKRETVRGDEFDGIQFLDKLAYKLDQVGKNLEAEKARDCAKSVVASELNEMDGFAR